MSKSSTGAEPAAPAAGRSIHRVEAAARALGLAVEFRRMPASTRTAAEAASACGCALDQIVKSLVFRGATSGRLALLLVAGGNRVDPAVAAALAGEPLGRADPAEVRRRTGFAIGGVAPIGHLEPLPVWMDRRLLDFAEVWAAAGAPDAVFRVAPHALRAATGATVAAFG
jgi:prolyl-tRNA editing enzyme YbaK/EbsC (Cys-tRNA(Pro) deacylase)